MYSISHRNQRFAQRVNEMGADYSDAPVSVEIGAREGTLVDYGWRRAESLLTALKPLLDILAEKYHPRWAAMGMGKTCKVANQIIVALNIEAVSEALVFASKAGASSGTRAALRRFASSRILKFTASG